MPEPKDRHSNRSPDGQNSPAGAKRGYETQAHSALRNTRVVAQAPKSPAGTENLPASRSLEATLIQKLIAFFKEAE